MTFGLKWAAVIMYQLKRHFCKVSAVLMSHCQGNNKLGIFFYINIVDVEIGRINYGYLKSGND